MKRERSFHRRQGRKCLPASMVGLAVFVATFGAWSPTVSGQRDAVARADDPAYLSRRDLRQDIAYLDRKVRAVHPDPFTAFGGRVPYQLAIRELADRVPARGFTRDEFANFLRPLFARLRDGHSWLTVPKPKADGAERYLPIRFRVAFDAIFVSEAQPDYQDLIGHRLVSAGGRSVTSLRAAAALVLPAENEFHASWSVTRKLASAGSAADLSLEPAQTLALVFLDASGVTVARRIEYVLSEKQWRSDDWVGRRWDRLPETNAPFFYRLWPERHAAYLRLRTIMGREAFDLMRANGRTDLDQRIRWFYRRFMEASRPEDMDEAIARMPSVTETTRALLTSMKREDIEHLILDLRGNDGGWSAIMIPFYYMLHGDRYFADESPVVYATHISEEYLDLTATSLEAFNADRDGSYELGDLLVSAAPAPMSPEDRRRRYLAELDELGVGFRKQIASLDGNALCSPRVYVITDPATFSAAYDLMYHLWRFGAKIVGVPSRQSSNTFVDPTPFELPSTKIGGAISRTAVRYPLAPDRNGVWTVDFPMTWGDFRKYDFDAHGDVRFVLDMIDRP